MKEIIQLLYTSRSRPEISLDSIYRILEISQKNNRENGLTGILLYRNGEFIQLLEGERLNVYYTLKKIMKDERHSDVKVLHEKRIEHRLFERWSMAFKTEFDYNPEVDARLNELKSSDVISNNLKLMQSLNSFFYRKGA